MFAREVRRVVKWLGYLASHAESTVRESAWDETGFGGTTAGATLADRLSPGKSSPPEFESSAAVSTTLLSTFGGRSDWGSRLVDLVGCSSL